MSEHPDRVSERARVEAEEALAEREAEELTARHAPARHLAHATTCPRHAHGGPCHGPLRYELPETAAERHDRHVQAVLGVLRNRVPLIRGLSFAQQASIAEDVLAAAETGI